MKKFYLLAILVIIVLLPGMVAAQWTQNTALVGGRTVEIIKFNSGLYAVAGDGLFKSTDNAANWTRTALPFMGGGASLVLHKTYLLVITPGIVYRTTDGNNWSTFYTAPNYYPSSSDSDDQTIYVSNYTGLYYSTDDGLTWTKRTETEVQAEITSVLVKDQVIFAAVGFEHPGTLLRSTDGGAHWQSIVVSTKQINRILEQNGTLYVSVNYEGLYKSTNNGDTWQLTSAQAHDSRFAVNSTNIYAINGAVFQMSTNGGTSWSSHSLMPGNRFTIQLYPTDDYLYAATLDGIFRAPVNDPTTWVGVNKGLNAQIVNDIVVTDGKILAGTEAAYVFGSLDQGVTWSQPLNTANLTTRVMYNSGTSIYKTDNVRIERSDDEGATWISCAQIPNYPLINTITMRSDILIVGGQGVFMSDDNGLSWVDASVGITSPIRNLFTFQNDVYAGTYNGLFKLNLDGETWSRINTGATSENITSINGFGSHLFIGTLSGIYKSTDKGSHWSQVSFEGGTITLAVRNSELYASYHWGNQYHSLDSGKTWINIKGNLPASYVRAMNFTRTDMLISVHGHGIYTRPLATLSPPLISTPTGYDTLIGTTSPIVITTDQPLYTSSGDELDAGNLSSVFEIYNDEQQAVPFIASISDDGLTITLTITSPMDGAGYRVFIDDLENEAGLTVPASSFGVRLTMNEAPSVQSFSIQMNQKTTYPYTLQQFSEHFSDPESDAIAGIRIVSLPLHGTLYVNTTPIAENAAITSAQLSTLRYTPDVSFVGHDFWNFIAFDGTRYSKLSAKVTMDVVQVTAVEKEVTDMISIYPNPVTDRFIVKGASSHSILDVTLVDIAGRQLNVRKENFSEGTIVHTGDMQPGLYVVKVKTPVGWVQRRIARK